MSANSNSFKNSNGGIALDVTSDGEFLSDLINYDQGSYCEIYFEFYEDEALQIPASPSAGTIISSATPLGEVFLLAANNSTVSAVDVSYPNATYEPPIIDGLVRRAKVSVSGIVGASYMRAVLFNHI
jgi:hypothetical protein